MNPETLNIWNKQERVVKSSKLPGIYNFMKQAIQDLGNDHENKSTLEVLLFISFLNKPNIFLYLQKNCKDTSVNFYIPYI